MAEITAFEVIRTFAPALQIMAVWPWMTYLPPNPQFCPWRNYGIGGTHDTEWWFCLCDIMHKNTQHQARSQ